MYLKSLHLKNFKMYESKDVNFDPHFNVIIGDNGTGKTTILEAITVALSPYLERIYHKVFRRLKKDDIRYSLHDYGTKHDVFCTVNVRVMILNRNVGWNITRTRTNWEYNKVSLESLNRALDTLFSKESKESYLPIIKYYGPIRFIKDQSRRNSDNRTAKKAAYNQALNKHSSIRSVTDWIKKLERSAKDEDEFSKVHVELLKKIILTSIPGWTSLSFHSGINELVATRYNAEKQTEELVPFSYLSDGQRTMMSLVVDIAYRCYTLNPHFHLEGKDATKETEGIVLIDEIDVHLHPEWQRKVVQMLKDVFPKIQFIVTTHSPFIIQSLESNELINLNERYSESGYEHRGIEWIADSIMDVKNVEFGSRYTQQRELAKQYLLLLEKMKRDKNAREQYLNEFRKVEEEMKLLAKKDSINPAYSAFLELKRNKVIDF